jgi:hypothetical protein
MLAKYPMRSLESPARVLDGTANILTVHDSQLHMLNPMGTFIWEHADGRQSLSSIIDQICDVYAVEHDVAAKDAADFVENCILKGVLVLNDKPIE